MNVTVTDATQNTVTVVPGSPIVVQPATGPVTSVNTHTGEVVINNTTLGAFPAAGGTFTGPIALGSWSVDAAGNVTALSLTLPATSTTVSKSLVIPAPTGAVTYAVWRAPKACTVVAVRGYRAGGTSATINAQVNAADLLPTDLSLSTASTWLSGPSVQNTAMAAGDTLSLAVRTAAGTPTAVTVQVDLQGL